MTGLSRRLERFRLRLRPEAVKTSGVRHLFTILIAKGVGQERVGMGIGARVLRGVGLAAFILGGVFFGVTAVAVPRDLLMPNLQAASWSKAIAGSRPTPSAPTSSAGGGLNAADDRRGAEGPLRDRPVPGYPHPSGWRPADRDRGRKPGHQPDRLRRQCQSQGRAAPRRDPVQSPRYAVAADRAVRHPAHHRAIPPQRPLRRARGAEGHRTAEQPRRPRLRGQRRQEDRRQEHPVRRQPLLLGLPAEGHHQDHRVQFPQLPEVERRLRSRPDRGRSRPAAPLLSEAWVRRRPRGLGGERIRSPGRRVYRDLHDRRGRAVQVRSRRHPVERARRRRCLAC